MSVIFIDYEEDNEISNLGRCVYRSKQKEEGQTGCCGGKKTISAYKCEKRGIFPLNSMHCSACSDFKDKNVSS